MSCGLLLEAVDDLLNEHPDLAAHVSTERWDLKTTEGLERINKLGISLFPTIALDGIIAFQGLIPDQDELLKSMRSRI